MINPALVADEMDRLLRRIGELEGALDKAEGSMDWFNGTNGTKSRPCCFCRAEGYNAQVGIVHLSDCPILVARAVLEPRNAH